MSSSKASKYTPKPQFVCDGLDPFMGWKVKPHEDMEGFNITYDENAIDVFLYVLQNVLPPDAIEERMDDDHLPN